MTCEWLAPEVSVLGTVPPPSPGPAGRVWGCSQGSTHEVWLAFVALSFWWHPASAWNGSSSGKLCSLPLSSLRGDLIFVIPEFILTP